MAEAVSVTEPKAVVEGAVDALGVVAARVEAFKVGIVSGDGSDILGPVQLPRGVVRSSVETDGDDPAPEGVRESVVVVPAVLAALVPNPVGPNPGEGRELKVAELGKVPDTDRTTAA